MRCTVYHILFAALCVLSSCEVYFRDEFKGDDLNWRKSDAAKDAGTLVRSSRKHVEDEALSGLKTSEDNKFYHYSASLDKPFNTQGKDLVLQLSLQHEQVLTCGGGYLKLLFEDSPKNFNGNTKYGVMFGPDACGFSKRIHLIFTVNGKNILKTNDIPYTLDRLIHVYALHVKADKTYAVFVDEKEVSSGAIEVEWELFGKKMIKDPNDKKPEDWDSIKTIPDETAVKPDDWDDEELGPWDQPMIDNPDFKEYEIKQIENPDYLRDEHYAEYKFSAIGLDIWQVESGSIFDNILLTDDVELANKERVELCKSLKTVNIAIDDALIAEEASKKGSDQKISLGEEEQPLGDDDDDDDSEDHDEL